MNRALFRPGHQRRDRGTFSSVQAKASQFMGAYGLLALEALGEKRDIDFGESDDLETIGYLIGGVELLYDQARITAWHIATRVVLGGK